MTHAEKLRDAERAVFERAVTEADEHGGCGCLLCEVVREWRDTSAQTCPDCGGEGSHYEEDCSGVTELWTCPNPRCVNGAIPSEVKP